MVIKNLFPQLSCFLFIAMKEKRGAKISNDLLIVRLRLIRHFAVNSKCCHNTGKL